MKHSLNESKPIFIQIAEGVEDEIINGKLIEGEQVPSTNQFASFYQINPATAAKGINMLVDEGILYKRRGIGMFITDGAKEMLLQKRKKHFYDEFILSMLQEANKINITKQEVIEMINQNKGGIKK